MQLIDTTTSQSLFIAATNHESLLDSAVWRRFDEVILFEPPTLDLRVTLLKHYLAAIRYPGIDLTPFAEKVENATATKIYKTSVHGWKITLASEQIISMAI